MVSICIPVRNSGPEFGEHLLRWKQQKTTEEVEILILDSGSQDDTVEIARSLGARVHITSPAEFNHGKSRNRLAELARGDLLIFTVADACPVNGDTLIQLTQPLRQDAEFAGVTGKQLPRRNADLMARWETNYIAQTFDKGPRKKQMPPLAKFTRMDFNQQIEIIGFDNVCSAMQRSVWRQFPFSSVEFAEDLDWSYRVMKSGLPILHNPNAQVFHSHNFSPWHRFRRSFVGRYRMNTVVNVPAAVFAWSEDEAFSALPAFRSEVSKVRKKICEDSQAVAELKIPRDFKYLCFRAIEKWGPLALGKFHQPLLRPYPMQWLESYFNYICWQVLRRYGSLSPTQALFLADQAEAQAVGDFLGQCYYRSKRLGSISEEFACLGTLLRRHYGVIFDDATSPDRNTLSGD